MNFLRQSLIAFSMTALAFTPLAYAEMETLEGELLEGDFGDIEYVDEDELAISLYVSIVTENDGPGCCDEGEPYYYDLDGYDRCTGYVLKDGKVHPFNHGIRCNNDATFCAFDDFNPVCVKLKKWCKGKAKPLVEEKYKNDTILSISCAEECLSTRIDCPRTETDAELENEVATY